MSLHFPADPWFLLPLIFSVAFLYSSVGHGGASGYLAVMSLFAFNPQTMSTTALILNIVVSAVSFFSYKNAGHFNGSLLYPFLILSVPMSWLGGRIRLPVSSYALLLASVLLFAAFRLNVNVGPDIRSEKHNSLNFSLALLVGGSIGFVSGVVGIGGGIFLSSFLLLVGWATTKESSALAAPFILINSIAGLLPRLANQEPVWSTTRLYSVSAFAGGLLGSHLGANRFTVIALRRILGLVLILASVKLIFH